MFPIDGRPVRDGKTHAKILIVYFPPRAGDPDRKQENGERGSAELDERSLLPTLAHALILSHRGFAALRTHHARHDTASVIAALRATSAFDSLLRTTLKSPEPICRDHHKNERDPKRDHYTPAPGCFPYARIEITCGALMILDSESWLIRPSHAARLVLTELHATRTNSDPQLCPSAPREIFCPRDLDKYAEKTSR